MEEHLEDMELRSESVRDILTRVPPWTIRWGNLLLLGLLFLLIFLSWAIKYPDTLDAHALLTTEVPPQPVHARVSAAFDTILVQNDELVMAHRVLAILENSANSDDVFYLKRFLDSVPFDQNALDFPFDELPLLLLGEIEPDFARFENGFNQLKALRRFQPFRNTERASKISLQELRERLGNIQVQKEIGQHQLEIEKNDLERNRELLGKGVISKQEFENKQSEYYTQLKNFQNLGAMESQIREGIATASNTLKGSTFNKSNEELKVLKEVLQAYSSLIKGIKDWELKYVLKAKLKGKVSFLGFWNKNQAVESGDLVFKVLPDTTTDIIAKLTVDPQNTGKIKVGQKVNLSLWDFPEYEFGVLLGKVSAISRTTDSEGLYKITVSIPQQFVSSYGKKLEFRQEMTGKGTIILEDLRLIERLLYQFRELFQKG